MVVQRLLCQVLEDFHGKELCTFENATFTVFHWWGTLTTDTLLHSGSLNRAAKQKKDFKEPDLTITLYLCDKLDLLSSTVV